MSVVLLQSILLGIAASVGGVVILLFLHTLFHGIYARLLRPGKNIVKKFGPWGEPISLFNSYQTHCHMDIYLS
jgi:hypothetical protein